MVAPPSGGAGWGRQTIEASSWRETLAVLFGYDNTSVSLFPEATRAADRMRARLLGMRRRYVRPGRRVSIVRPWSAMVLLALPGCRPAAAQDALAFINVDVVSMTEQGILRDRTVILRDGLIDEIGPAASLDPPAGAEIIDGDGRYLAPGLIDFHVHLRATSELVSYLRHGVTTIVQLSGGLTGAPDVLEYRRALADGELIGPTLHASGAILDGDPPINPGVSTVVTTPDEGRAAVRRQAAQGYDLVKVYNRLPDEVLAPVVEEAHRLGLPVAGHIPRAEDRGEALQNALSAGLDVIAHAEEIFFTYFYAGIDSMLDLGEVPWRSEEDVERVATWIADAGTYVIPNLSFVAATRTQLDSIDVLWSDPELAYLEPAVREFWREDNFAERDDVERFDRRERAKEEFLDRLVVALENAGVPLMLGTDASFVGLFPGASAHLELRELVEAGLTPEEAFAAGTSGPGRFLLTHGMSSVPVGVIEPGGRADLILLEDDPLEDVGAAQDPIGVVARGRWLSRQELDSIRSR